MFKKNNNTTINDEMKYVKITNKNPFEYEIITQKETIEKYNELKEKYKANPEILKADLDDAINNQLAMLMRDSQLFESGLNQNTLNNIEKLLDIKIKLFK